MKVVLRIFCAGLLAFLILCVFSEFYDCAGIHVYNDEGFTDFVWLPNRLRTSMAEGFAWVRMDAQGLNNAVQPEEIELMMMGSSHMDSIYVSSDQTAPFLLNESGIGTLNIGVSKHTIYRCVDNYASAVTHFSPKKYTVIETHNIDMSMEEMRKVIERRAERYVSYDSGLMYALQFLPAFHSLYFQLENWVSKDFAQADTVSGVPETLPEGYEETLRQFLSLVSDPAKEGGVTPIIFFHPYESLAADGNVEYNTNQAYLDAFANVCEQLGIVFIDLTEASEALYETEHQLTHGFINTAVGQGHLNGNGHRVLATTLTELIEGLEAA